MIEKHFTLDRALGGVDADFSLNIEEFAQMVQAVRNTEKLLGMPSYDVSEQSRKFARSLFVVKDIQEGKLFTEENIRSIRAGDGLAPKQFKEIMGRRAAVKLTAGTPLRLNDVQR